MQKRYEATAKLLEKSGIEYVVLDGQGEGQLSQALGLLMLGDYTSTYLAFLNGTDPTPIEAIDFLKKRLE
jgi:glucose/mannose-6-phosphate isomerase